jgi:hypothetical protein
MKFTGETEVLWEKPVPVSLCPPKIPHGLTPRSKPCLRGERPATNRLSHGTASNALVILHFSSDNNQIFASATDTRPQIPFPSAECKKSFKTKH